jgi:hypothetical protein
MTACDSIPHGETETECLGTSFSSDHLTETSGSVCHGNTGTVRMIARQRMGGCIWRDISYLFVFISAHKVDMLLLTV